MGIDTGSRQLVEYFIGTEVERTAMFGEKTLFVVGIKPVEDITAIAEKHDIKHLYFGTSQTFHPQSQYEWADWDSMIKPLLLKGYWVTLDFGIEYLTDDYYDQKWDDYNTYIPMLSAKLRHVRKLNYNSTLKLDDTTWGDTNPGVWCHPLNELLTRNVYTDWKDYVGDTPIEE
jgi:hypothetical protein